MEQGGTHEEIGQIEKIIDHLDRSIDPGEDSVRLYHGCGDQVLIERGKEGKISLTHSLRGYQGQSSSTWICTTWTLSTGEPSVTQEGYLWYCDPKKEPESTVLMKKHGNRKPLAPHSSVASVMRLQDLITLLPHFRSKRQQELIAWEHEAKRKTREYYDEHMS